MFPYYLFVSEKILAVLGNNNSFYIQKRFVIKLCNYLELLVVGNVIHLMYNIHIIFTINVF